MEVNVYDLSDSSVGCGAVGVLLEKRGVLETFQKMLQAGMMAQDVTRCWSFA